jgi:acetylornithine deacetylase/succinyl-diaminopimelate desuccinylase family protein
VAETISFLESISTRKRNKKLSSELKERDLVAYKKVIRQIESMRNEIVSMTSELIRRQSVNPNFPDLDSRKYLGGEKDCNLFLEKYLGSIGCKTDLFEKSKDRANLVGVIQGVKRSRSLILSGHIDTVPFGNVEAWHAKNPLSGRVENGRIFGRGACDMKSGIVAMCKALEGIFRSGFRPDATVILESVVGEETMDHLLGTSATVERGYRADSAIIAEPSSLRLSPASTGVIIMEIIVEGKSTHSTARDMMIRAGGRGDEVGVNAIEKAVKIIELLQQLEQQWGITKQHPLFNPGHFVIHPGVINGASRSYRYVSVVPDYCSIEYAILYSPRDFAEDVEHEIQNYVSTGSKLDSWLSKNPPKIVWKGIWPPGEVTLQQGVCNHLASSYELALGETIRVIGFPAPVDAPFLNQAGIPTVIFGPGNLAQAHSENEYVEIEQVIKAAKTIALTVMQWCGFSAT